LGSYSWNIGVGTPARTYEISNYLGNVMATIGDGQIPRMNGSLIEYYDADIKSATDYYSFGMVMPGRSFNSGTYRYGFNGQENDNEVKGAGNQVAYENRIYDPRLGRWFSLDPMAKKYPGESHYAFVSNNPIIYADEAGLDKIVTVTRIGKDGKKIVTSHTIKNKFKFVADYSVHTYPDIPGRSFNVGFKYDEIINYTFDENNPANNSVSKDYKIVERYSNMLSYYSAKKKYDWFSSDLSESSKIGMVLMGNGGGYDDNQLNPRAAIGSEILDIANLVSVLEGFREINGGSGNFLDFASDPQFIRAMEFLDNAAKSYEKLMQANGGEHPIMEKEMKNETGTIIKVLPAGDGPSNTDTLQWMRTSPTKDKPDTLFKKPVTKKKKLDE
jgi:RHS repeat-associated protein